MRDQSHKRHIVKAITWRIIGTLDTMLLAWWISGNPVIGMKVGLAEILTKIGLYYVHERIWFRVNLSNNGVLLESRKRHLAKTVTWRLVGTLDTMLLAWWISGNPLIGLQVGLAEIVTKMVLYYFHERVWFRINFGLSNRKEENE